ncbi:MAG TPA: hypothetical protein VFP42_02675 [Acidimicrobiia bacterium]|nr:hypothetical protein [Acidimicrobiia bacterium]
MSLDWFPEEIEPRPIERNGVRVAVPPGWEGRISQQLDSGEGEITTQVVHAATIPLTGQRADYGGGVVERLGRDDIFISLVEFGPDEADTALFKTVDQLPSLDVAMFHRNQLQRRIRGQAGVQHFFTYEGRPFCLYVVLGSVARAPELVAKANEMLAGIAVAP